MGRRMQWKMSPEETLELAVSFDSELDSAASLTGETPTVTVWTRAGRAPDYTYTEVTGDFTIASAQVNTSALTTESGETIAIGRGVAFRITTPTTAATYYVRTECDADDSTHVVRTPYDVLIVAGPPAGA